MIEEVVTVLVTTVSTEFELVYNLYHRIHKTIFLIEGGTCTPSTITPVAVNLQYSDEGQIQLPVHNSMWILNTYDNNKDIRQLLFIQVSILIYLPRML